MMNLSSNTQPAQCVSGSIESSCNETPKGQLANLPCVSPVMTTRSHVTPRYSDRFYQHDLVNGTTLNERKIDQAIAAWLIAGIVLFCSAYTPLLIFSSTFPPLFLLLSLVCPVVVGIGAAIFFSKICSTSSKQHAQQVLGPSSQEKANTIQRQAMEYCRQKQQEINLLKQDNDRHEAEIRDLEQDATREKELFESGVIDQRYTKTRLEQVIAEYNRNLACIAKKQKEKDRVVQIYKLQVGNDSNGFAFSHAVQEPNPAELPQ